MVHLQLLLLFALCAAALAHEGRERDGERERDRDRRPWSLDSVRETPYGREGPERERLLEGKRLIERINLERNIQRARLERIREERQRIGEEPERIGERRERIGEGRERNGEGRERIGEGRERIGEGRERIGEGRERIAEGRERIGTKQERIVEERLIHGPIGYGLQPERPYGYGHGRGLNELYGYGLRNGPSYSLVPWLEPTKGVLSNGRSGNIELQNKIVRDVYSPAYNQPEYIVDYRFLRSGGRAFVRGPGGQIIILPRSVKESELNSHNSYDRLIEELQLEEEHSGRVPYRRVVVESAGQSGYRRDRLEERRGELGYMPGAERREEYGPGYEGLGERRKYGYGDSLGRIPREEKYENIAAAAPKAETAGATPEIIA